MISATAKKGTYFVIINGTINTFIYFVILLLVLLFFCILGSASVHVS